MLTSLRENLIKPSPVTLCSFPDCYIIKGFIQHWDDEISRLNDQIRQLQEEKAKLAEDNERLRAMLNFRNSALFGRSSEKSPASPGKANGESIKNVINQNCGQGYSSADNIVAAQVRKRGARPGHRGFGRKIPDLFEVEMVHEIPYDQMFCPVCGKALKYTNLTEDSYEIDYEVKFVRIKHIRKKAVRTCNCPGPKFVTAEKPPQVIPKGKFSNNFLAHVLVQKFFFQVPLHRLAVMMLMQGLSISEGTLTGIFKMLLPFLEPLYLLLAEVNRNDDHWHIDETGWMNFVQVADKKGCRWWLWVFISKLTVVFALEPSRSSSVPFTHLGQGACGIISCDRYSAYGKLTDLVPGLKRALCWSHFRRDFVDAGKSLSCLKAWADLWLERIAVIYRLNDKRLAVLDNPAAFADAQLELECALQVMLESIQAELSDPGLHWQQKKVLESAQKNWGGLTVFVDNPHVPMDNNLAERTLRPAALGRKNYYGTHSEWSGRFMAVSMSILQTAARHGLNVEAYLRYYLDACAKNSGPPPDLERFLPWNIPEDAIREYSMRMGVGTA